MLFNEFQAYIKSLCEQHKDILHEDGVRTGFVRFAGDEDINSLLTNGSPNIVIMTNFIGRAIGGWEDDKVRQNVSLSFLCHAQSNTGNPAQDVQNAYALAERIMFDFYARMKHDYEQNDCGELQGIQPELMSYRAEVMNLEYHFGWELTLPFDTSVPIYNPAHWNL